MLTVVSSCNEEVVEIDLQMTLRNELAQRLIDEAARLRREPVVLLADIIERVLTDNLVGAVLDE